MLLITGITGHSGRFFLQELDRQHYTDKIRCVIRNESDDSLFANRHLDIEILQGDLEDIAFLNKACEGVDTVFHIASIFFSAAVVQAALQNHVNRIILVHTTGVYSKYKKASGEYLAIEEIVNRMIDEAYEKPKLIILRPTMIFGYAGDRNRIQFIKLTGENKSFSHDAATKDFQYAPMPFIEGLRREILEYRGLPARSGERDA